MADIDTTDPIQPPDGVSAETPAGPALRIFINYRHEDMPFAALTLYRELKGQFGAGEHFFRRRHAATGNADSSKKSRRA